MLLGQNGVNDVAANVEEKIIVGESKTREIDRLECW